MPQTRPTSNHRIVMRVSLAGRVACHGQVMVVPVQRVLVRVSPRSSFVDRISGTAVVVGLGVRCMPPIVAGASVTVRSVV